MEDYVYQPLDDGYIRLVEVFSDTIDAPLQCRIFPCRLVDTLSVSYEALSYVWGPQEPLHDLLCGDVKPRVLRIGPNLLDALLHLRLHPWNNPNSRLLWIDRICINQDDIEERASQVELMHYIYKICRQALVWLGMEDWNTEVAFEFARFFHKNGFEGETPWQSLALFRSPAVSFADLGSILSVLTELTYRPWFERAWTFQEVILPSAVSLVCGKSSMPLECLEACRSSANRQARVSFSNQANLIFTTRKIKDKVSYWRGGRLPDNHPEPILSFRREAKMSDPRDYIFSLLGLFSPDVSFWLSPNYSTSVKDLFTAVAAHIIRASEKIRILCSVESPKHVDGEAFPSWVPDWSSSSESIRNVLRNRNTSSTYRATRDSVLDYDPLYSNELHLYGIAIGAVDQAGRYNDVHSISEFDLGSRYNHTNQPITAALRQAQTFDIDVACEMIGVEHPDRRRLADLFDIPVESRARRRKCNQCPTAHTMPIYSMEKAEKNPKLSLIIRQCSENVRYRAFFTTDSRYFGFGPKCTAAGDQVFLLIGSDVPFILRPAGKKFELVGACYVHGVMYGEGLCQDSHINNRFYPGSMPGGWNFSGDKVPQAEWRIIEEDSDSSQVGDSICHELARTTRDTISEASKGLKARRYLLCEKGRSPVLINTKRVVIK